MPHTPAQHSRGAAAAASYVLAPYAERWNVRLARTQLRARTHLPDADHEISAAAGFSVGPNREHILVLYTQEHSLAVPRRPAFRRRWDTALDNIEEALEQAGFTDLRRTAKSVAGQAPIPAEPLTTVRVRPVGPPDEFTAAVSFDGYDDGAVAGVVNLLSGRGPRAVLVAANADGTPIGYGYRDREHAARCLADHYGLPIPLRIVHEQGQGL